MGYKTLNGSIEEALQEQNRMNSKDRKQRDGNYQRNNLRIRPELKDASLLIIWDDQMATTIDEKSPTPKHIMTKLMITWDRENPKSSWAEKSKAQTQITVSEWLLWPLGNNGEPAYKILREKGFFTWSNHLNVNVSGEHFQTF